MPFFTAQASRSSNTCFPQADIGRFLHTPGNHLIAARFPLAETAAAHEMVEAGKKRGTVVVEP
jgi:hypothetical protein